MADKRIFVEKRDQGDFAVRRAGSQRASAVAPTQGAAIKRAEQLEPGIKPHVARVRHTSRGKPDQFR